jgi:hypothetical protein
MRSQAYLGHLKGGTTTTPIWYKTPPPLEAGNLNSDERTIIEREKKTMEKP